MPKPGSSRGRGKNIQKTGKVSEDVEGSEDNDSHQSGNRSHSSASDVNISAHSDRSHHRDTNVNSHSEAYKRYPSLNSSTSSNNDALDEAVGSNTYRPTSSLYPPLDKLTTEDESSESEDDDEHRSSKDHVEKHQDSDNSTTIMLIVIGVIIVLILSCLYFCVQDSSIQHDNNTVTPFDRFVGHVKNLEHILPSQNKRLWRTVKASAMHVLQDTNPKYPMVILMASMTDRSHVSRCIANKIASSFYLNQGMSPQMADIREFQNLNPAWQKEKLDEKLNSAFSSDQRKSFIIDNLQLLHPEAALLLHGYCDGDNAPHKDVMLVLLLHIDENDVTGYNNAAIESYLEQQWSRSLELDKVKALLSRVANNVVTIESEHDEDFKKACQ